MVKKRSSKHKKIQAHNPIPLPKKIRTTPIVIGLFVLLFITIIGIVNTSATVTGQAIAKQNIDYLKEGTITFIEVKNIQGLEGITAELSAPMKNSYFLIEQSAPQKKNGIYNSFILSSPDRASIKRVVLNLKIKESDLKILGITTNQLKIQNNEEKLKPILMKTENGYAYYTLQSNRLGTFTFTI